MLDLVPFFVAESPGALGIVGTISRLAAALRVGGGTVAWLLRAGAPAREDFCGSPVTEVYQCGRGRTSVHDDDILAEKTAASVFALLRET